MEYLPCLAFTGAVQALGLEALELPQTSLSRKWLPSANKHLSFLHLYICSSAVIYMTKETKLNVLFQSN